MTELKLGSQGAEVGRFFDHFAGTPTRKGWAQSYAFLLGKRDLYYGSDEKRFTEELQRRLLAAGKPVSATGVFGDREAAATGYKWGGTVTPPTPPAHRPIWFYSMPGSGAPGNVGPPFLVGEDCRNILHINHQWIGYPIGGYLGLLGGNPEYSYLEVCEFAKAELRRQISLCPDLADPKLELWFCGYSQGAEAMLLAVHELFGDDGEFKHLRPRINGIICFGNPATQGTGIANRIFPDWLNKLTRNINHPNDFYAVAPDKIRRIFYREIIKSEISLPYIVHVLKIAIPAILKFIPVFGGLLGPLAPMIITGAAGVSGSANMLGGLMGGVLGPDDPVDAELERLLSLEGLLTSFPDLIGLIAALPGLQAHGFYDHRAGFDIVASFRR
jgi:hypothetical protein